MTSNVLGVTVNPAPVCERLYLMARAASMIGLGAGATLHVEAGLLNLRPPLRWLGERCDVVTLVLRKGDVLTVPTGGLWHLSADDTNVVLAHRHTDHQKARKSLWRWAATWRVSARCLVGALASAVLASTALAGDVPAQGGRTCAGFESQILVIDGTAADHAAACEGFARAVGFFARLGYQTELPVTIQFSDTVVLPVKDANGHKTFVAGTRVVGLYEVASQRVTMTSLSAPWLRQRPYFKLRFDRELLVSVLAHESAHALSKAFYRYTLNPNAHAQEEYIAYAAQLSTMAPGKLKQVLAQFPARRWTFADEHSINDLVHGVAPHAFGVMSFNHFNGSGGGRAFLKRIYSGDFKPLDFTDLN